MWMIQAVIDFVQYECLRPKLRDLLMVMFIAGLIAWVVRVWIETTP